MAKHPVNLYTSISWKLNILVYDIDILMDNMVKKISKKFTKG